MRTNLHTLLPKVFLASLVVLAQSCINDNLSDNDGGGSDYSEFPLEITAKAPARSTDGTGSSVAVKTLTPDGKKVYWEPGDQVALCPGASVEAERYDNVVYTADITQAQPSATFIRNDVKWNYEDGDFYLAAFPLASVNRWGSVGNHTCYLNPPVVQTARIGGWDPKAGCLVAMSRTSEFEFEHAVAYVKFTVNAETSPFTSVQIAVPGVPSIVLGDTERATDKIRQVLDEIKVTYVEGSITSSPHNISRSVLVNDYAPDQYPSTKVVLNSPDGEVFGHGSYYIALLPQEYPDGLSVVFWSADGKAAVKKLVEPVTLNRGDVANVGTIGQLDFKPTIKNHTLWGDKEGVVFWVDESDPSQGKIVSICSHEPIQWATDVTYAGGNGTDPVVNYDIIVNGRSDEEIKEKFPAIDFCKQLRKSNGGNWHLPSIEELRVLYNSYYARNYVSPIISGKKDGSEGYDFRYKNGNQSVAGYQAVLTSKKNFDELLATAGEQSPASLDGVNVTGSPGSYSIDPDSETDEYGIEKGVLYWTARENREDGTSSGHNAYYLQFGFFMHYNALKSDTDKYVRCIKDVSIE